MQNTISAFEIYDQQQTMQDHINFEDSDDDPGLIPSYSQVQAIV